MTLLCDIKVPLIAVNDTTLTLLQTCFNNGDKINKGDVMLVFETSKTTYDVVSEFDGYIQNLGEPGKDYEVNEVVAKIFSTPINIAGDLDKLAFASGSKISASDAANWKGETIFSKGAALLMKSNQIEPVAFTGSDFINLDDVEIYLGIKTPVVQEKRLIKVDKVKPGDLLPFDAGKIIPEKLAANKKKEIAYLNDVQSGGLTSTINTFINTEGIFISLNKALKALKNSLLPVVIYETSRLLKKYKELNAYFSGDSIAFYKNVNVGFAIDLEKGLKVVAVNGAQEKSINEIEQDILNGSGKYLDDLLKYEDISDITFTITDLSSESVAFFQPLINMMNSAILGISSIDEKLNRCIFSITFDHRVTEGKLVAVFLKDLKARIESYRLQDSAKSRIEVSCFKCFKNLEEDISEVGFVKCITPNGKEAFICQSCLKGY